MWGHVVVSTVRRSLGRTRTAVRLDKKFSLQSSAENCTVLPISDYVVVIAIVAK